MYDFPILRELGANPKGIDWAGRQTEVFDGPTTDISTAYDLRPTTYDLRPTTYDLGTYHLPPTS